jgi:hypothetical protein
MGEQELTGDPQKFDQMVRSRLRLANLAARLRAGGIQVVWLVIIIAGAAIPLAEALITDGWTWVSPVLGFVIVIAAGLERILSRTTDAAVALDQLRRELSRERRLLIARSGPYADAEEPLSLYAMRAEAVIASYDASMVDYNRRVIGGVAQVET